MLKEQTAASGRTSVVGIVLIVLFMAAQGAAVFATAQFGLRLMGKSHWFAKAAAMIVSYSGWVAFTIAGYALIGGEGGLMDGFALVLFLCSTALVSSFIYGLVWALMSTSEAEDPTGN